MCIAWPYNPQAQYRNILKACDEKKILCETKVLQKPYTCFFYFVQKSPRYLDTLERRIELYFQNWQIST